MVRFVIKVLRIYDGADDARNAFGAGTAAIAWTFKVVLDARSGERFA